MKDGESLNFMSAEPKMYIAAVLENGSKEEFLKECESRTYEIGNDEDEIYLLTHLSFDSEQQSLNETYNLAASAVIKGHRSLSLLRYSVDSIMVCSEYKALVLDMDTMDQLKAININTTNVPNLRD